MKKQKKLPSRRRRALRWCALLLLALLFAEIAGIYEFVPARGIRDLADRVGVEDPQVVEWFYDPSIPNSRSGIYMLVDGDRAMMLCDVRFSLSHGWTGDTWSTAPAWDGSGLYGGIYVHVQGEDRLGYVFGKITEPGIRRLTLWCEGWEQELYEMDIPETAVFSMEGDGVRYFLAPLKEEAMDEAAGQARRCFLIGETEDGGEVLTVEISRRLWSAPPYDTSM